ncbi:hypothetical protein CCACVL1_02711, partial [Corchorus capsularis]
GNLSIRQDLTLDLLYLLEKKFHRIRLLGEKHVIQDNSIWVATGSTFPYARRALKESTIIFD